MGNRSKTISKKYRVKPDADISVSLSIGAGQPGGWAMMLDDDRVADGKDKDTRQLGKGRDLQYRELRIEFVMHDRRPEHDRLVATAVLSGGESDMSISHEENGEPGDTGTYTFLVQFI